MPRRLAINIGGHRLRLMNPIDIVAPGAGARRCDRDGRNMACRPEVTMLDPNH
jgi:hypothetical protein